MRKKERMPFVILIILLFTSVITGCVPMAVTTVATKTVQVAHDRRTVGTLLDDQAIELKAQLRLKKIPEVHDFSHVVVTSYNNVLLVTGQVPHDYMKDEVTQALARIPKVRQVFNELTLGGSTSLKQRSVDTWITTKIKSSLLAEGKIDVTRVKVITENDVVYLLGLVTMEEAEAATLVARQTAGVKEVIRAFEYL